MCFLKFLFVLTRFDTIMQLICHDGIRGAFHAQCDFTCAFYGYFRKSYFVWLNTAVVWINCFILKWLIIDRCPPCCFGLIVLNFVFSFQLWSVISIPFYFPTKVNGFNVFKTIHVLLRYFISFQVVSFEVSLWCFTLFCSRNVHDLWNSAVGVHHPMPQGFVVKDVLISFSFCRATSTLNIRIINELKAQIK